MYTEDQQKQLYTLTRQLLQDGDGLAPAQLNDLRTVINFSDWRYYVESNPFLTDFEYDQLFARLKQIEAANPVLITPDSPSQRVAQGLTTAFKNVPHLVPMLSLDNSYNADDLLDWDRKCREQSGLTELEYSVEPKFDGASISLIYEDDQLARGTTRGDGIAGEDITVNVKQIRSIPLSAKFSDYGIRQVEIRGSTNTTNSWLSKTFLHWPIPATQLPALCASKIPGKWPSVTSMLFCTTSLITPTSMMRMITKLWKNISVHSK